MTEEMRQRKNIGPVDFRQIFESSPDMYLILDRDLHIVAASRAYLQATNITLQAVTGRHIFDVFPDNPQDPNASGTRNLGRSLDRVLKHRAVDSMPVQKYDIRKAEGEGDAFEERYWNPLNSPVLGADGEVAYIIHRVEDVTHLAHLLRKNGPGEIYLNARFLHDSLKSLHDSEARYAGAITSAMDGIISIDSRRKITIFNAAAENIFGYSAQEVMGKTVDFLMPERFRAAHDGHIRQFAATNVTNRKMGRMGEIVGLRANGEEFPIESSVSQMGNGDKKFFTVIMRDISEKKKIEAQFLRAQRMESIGTLAGGIAHDLNNILAPIMLSIGLLRIMTHDQKAREILETIDTSAKRGADIVQQVLSFARGIEGHIVEVQPRHLMHDVETILKDSLPKDIHLSLSVPQDTWTIKGDPTQLHQVILNLCVNARDAMPKGGQLTVGAENRILDDHYVAMNRQAKAGPHVLISVTDTGTGIPQNIINKIFEPFFTTKEVGKGTGLGLSTVQAIVKSHGGFVNVYSEPNRGTVFKIYLPAVPSSVSGTEGVRKKDVILRGHGETILIVDDEASILAITGQTLQAFGYKTVTAVNGAEAVAIYAQRRNDIAVVLTDMMMPIMDGPSTIHALLQINPAVRIIAASGLDANGSVAKAAGAGIKHFLKKPYTAETLLKTLWDVLHEEEKK